MIGLRSLRNRLAVVFGLIVLGAIGTIYLSVTPRLEERLRDQKLDRLLTDARRFVGGRAGLAATYTETTSRSRPDRARSPPRSRSSAEVLIFDGVSKDEPLALASKNDSAPDGGIDASDVTRPPLDAAAASRPVSVTASTAGRPHAIVALPADPGRGGRAASPCSPTRSTRSRATSR